MGYSWYNFCFRMDQSTRLKNIVSFRYCGCVISILGLASKKIYPYAFVLFGLGSLGLLAYLYFSLQKIYLAMKYLVFQHKLVEVFGCLLLAQ